jgi:hypothetical protein
MHPESAPSSFLGGNISTRDFQWVLRVLLTFFKVKMLELMEDLEYVQAYLDDLLCISRSSREDHLKNLEEVFRHLRDVGLKVNAEKLIFCALE